MSKKILYSFLIITPLIDTINGILINYNINIPVGVIYRFIFIIYLLFNIFLKGITKITSEFVLYYFIILYLIINPIIIFFVDFNTTALKTNLEFSSRILLFFVVIVAVTKIIQNNNDILAKVINVSGWIVPITIIIPYILGVGNNTYLDQYGLEVGYKGFYFSNNSLNAVIIVLFIFSLDRMFRNKLKIQYLIQFSLLFATMLIIGSKSSIFYSIVMIILYLPVVIKKMKVFHILGLGFGVFLTIITFWDQLIDIIFLQLSNMDNRSLFNYLVSDRDLYFRLALDYAIENITPLYLLFGFGSFGVMSGIGYHLSGNPNYFKTIEMDFFDLLFNMGVITFVPFIIILVYVLYQSFFLLTKKNREAMPFILSYIALLVFSILGGHVITEAFSITFFGIIIAGLNSIYNNRKSLNKL